MRRTELGRTLAADRFSGVGPSERTGHRFVEVVQEALQFDFQVRHRREVAATDDLSHHNAEDHLDLVQPRTVLGKIHEPDPVAGIRQEFTPAGLALQHSRFAFFFPEPVPAHKSSRPTPPTRLTNAR